MSRLPSEYEDDRRFRQAAIGNLKDSRSWEAMSELGVEIDLKPAGAWVPVRVFVTWKQAGVDPPRKEKRSDD